MMANALFGNERIENLNYTAPPSPYIICHNSCDTCARFVTTNVKLDLI